MNANLFDGKPALHSVEAERAALGSAFLAPQGADDVLGILEAAHYYSPAHQTIHEAMRRLYDRGEGIDLVTMVHELRLMGLIANVGGEDYLIQVQEYVPSWQSASHYARIVKDCWVKRCIMERAAALAKACSEEDTSAEALIAQAEGLPFGLGTASNCVRHISDVEDIQRGGLRSGFTALDARLSTRGLPKGQLTIVKAMQKEGKTSFMLSMMLSITLRGGSCLYATFADLSARDLRGRLVQALCGYPSRPEDDIIGRLQYDDASRVVSELKIDVYDASALESGTDVETFTAWLRGQQSKSPYDAAFCDYAQEMTSSSKMGDSMVNQQELASRKMRLCAMKLDIPITVGSQCTEDRSGAKFGGDSTRPSTTKWGRCWEERAGLVLRIRRPENNVIIEYSRFGPKGWFPVLWSDSQVRFLPAA